MGPQGPAGNDGEQGGLGPKGDDGLSAYEVYLDTTSDSPPMTAQEWLESLIGAGGANANQISYSNTESGLTATNTQTAIDEIVDLIGDVESLLSGI